MEERQQRCRSAKKAAAFWVSVFPRSRILDVSRYGEAGPGPEGAVMVVRFELDGQPFLALNGGPVHAGFTETVSFVIACTTQDGVDYYWDRLTDGGEEIACGWLKDRYGLRWQVVPDGVFVLIGDPDRARANAANKAMLSMKKLDLAAMRRAADAAAPT